ncbi:uncharacterized protein LOC111382663 [Olea europaea var. sylvestris]|uniref:uncharacterized protein LOC111382663 n=1 Tax=Olea europaea var. sylvestris TaxID=158386 RepID=UPI000C1D47EE|nr:uncharacterized protein LOC111382663 [Olea europaea var. sylvestris]
MDLKVAGEKHLLQLNELDEFKIEAYENSKLYKEHTKKWHDLLFQIREFEVGQKVLLYNLRLKLFSGKLRSRWSRTYTVTKVLPYKAIEVNHETKGTFTLNGQRLKHYWDGRPSKFTNGKPKFWENVRPDWWSMWSHRSTNYAATTT